VIAGPVRQLRDPAIFREDGRTWLLYSVAGENGIAIAELKDDACASRSQSSAAASAGCRQR
jgi:hypothetical protein